MTVFLEARLQVLLIFCLRCLVKTLLRCILNIRLGVSVHDTHVVNTVSPFIPEVPDQKAEFLFLGLWCL